MRRSKVGNVDVVADAGAVTGRIVVAKDGDVVALPVRDLQDDGNQVRFGVMRLTDLAGHMRTAGVKVAQRHEMNPVRDGGPVEHPLHGELRFAVAVGGVRRVCFQNRHALRLAVGCRRRREHDVLHAVLDHALQHRPCAAEVIIIILEGIYHALADLRVRGEVDDRVNFLRREHMVTEFLVADVALIEPGLRMHGCPEAGLQIVRHDHIIAVVNQFIHGVTADVPGAA